MNLKDDKVNVRKITGVLSQKEIYDALARLVGEATGVNVDSVYVEKKILIRSKELCGNGGFEYEATIEMTEDLSDRCVGAD